MIPKDSGFSLVSVIVPVYNPGPYFTPFLSSLQAQSWQNWQAILVDDGSTDGSGEAADAIARIDRRFTVIHQANRGAAAARAAGAAAARGNYLIFVDSDDLMHPDMLQILANGCIRYRAELAFCRFSPFTGQPKAEETISRTGKPMPGLQAQKMLLHDQRLDYALSNKLFSRKVITPDMLESPYRYNEDLLASWRAFAGVKTAVFFDFAGYHCRQHAGSTSHKGITLPFLNDQLSVAKLILRDSQGTPMQQSAEAFYYEKLLYLESMILRTAANPAFAELHQTLKSELRARYSAALHNDDIGPGILLCAVFSRRLHWAWHLACRTLLHDKR